MNGQRDYYGTHDASEEMEGGRWETPKAVQRVDADPSLTTCYCGPPGANRVGHDYGTGVYCADVEV